MTPDTFSDLVRLAVRLSSTEDVARLFSVSTPTVDRWVAGWELPTWDTPDNVAATLATFMLKHTEPT